MKHLTILALGAFVAFFAGSLASAAELEQNERLARSFADEQGNIFREISRDQARDGEMCNAPALGKSTLGNSNSAGAGNGSGNGSQMGSQRQPGNSNGSGTCDTTGRRSNRGSRGRSK